MQESALCEFIRLNSLVHFGLFPDLIWCYLPLLLSPEVIGSRLAVILIWHVLLVLTLALTHVLVSA